MNARVRIDNLGNTVERIATEIHISYDPRTRDALVTFMGEEFLTTPDGLTVGEQLAGRAHLEVALSAIRSRTFDAGTDPATGADLSRVSPAGLGNLLRAVYDALANEAARASGGTLPEQGAITAPATERA